MNSCCCACVMDEKIRFSHSGKDNGRSESGLRTPCARAIGGAAALRCKSEAPSGSICRNRLSSSGGFCASRTTMLSTTRDSLDRISVGNGPKGPLLQDPLLQDRVSVETSSTAAFQSDYRHFGEWLGVNVSRDIHTTNPSSR